MKRLFALILAALTGAALFFPSVAEATYTGKDPCGLAVHTCDYHVNGKVYTDVISAYGKHAYNKNPACQLIPGGPGGFTPTWTITAGYRPFPYSTDMIVSGTCPNCQIRICCGGEGTTWTAVETDP